MALHAERKKETVAEVRAAADAALSLTVAHAQGVSAEQMRALRAQAREREVVLRVVKNSLARRALEGTDFECMADSLAGPNLFAFAMKEPGAAAKLFKEFGGKHESFSVRSLSMDGRLFDGSQLDRLANLPTREEALARLLGTMQAPVAALAGLLRQIPTRLTRVLAAVRAQKEASD